MHPKNSHSQSFLKGNWVAKIIALNMKETANRVLGLVFFQICVGFMDKFKISCRAQSLVFDVILWVNIKLKFE